MTRHSRAQSGSALSVLRSLPWLPRRALGVRVAARRRARRRRRLGRRAETAAVRLRRPSAERAERRRSLRSPSAERRRSLRSPSAEHAERRRSPRQPDAPALPARGAVRARGGGVRDPRPARPRRLVGMAAALRGAVTEGMVRRVPTGSTVPMYRALCTVSMQDVIAQRVVIGPASAT